MQMRVFALGFLARASWGGPAQPRLVPSLRVMACAWQSRRILAAMSERELRDIGISRSDALREAARWPWDLGPGGV